jgi:hypothetical protein
LFRAGCGGGSIPDGEVPSGFEGAVALAQQNGDVVGGFIGHHEVCDVRLAVVD